MSLSVSLFHTRIKCSDVFVCITCSDVTYLHIYLLWQKHETHKKNGLWSGKMEAETFALSKQLQNAPFVNGSNYFIYYLMRTTNLQWQGKKEKSALLEKKRMWLFWIFIYVQSLCSVQYVCMHVIHCNNSVEIYRCITPQSRLILWFSCRKLLISVSAVKRVYFLFQGGSILEKK